MIEDRIFIEPIMKNSALKDRTKETYLRNIRYIQSEIMPDKGLYYILLNLAEFIRILETAKGRSGKPISVYTKDAFFSAILSIFYSNPDLRSKNGKLFNNWKSIHDRIREPINEAYQKKKI